MLRGSLTIYLCLEGLSRLIAKQSAVENSDCGLHNITTGAMKDITGKHRGTISPNNEVEILLFQIERKIIGVKRVFGL